MELQHFVVNDHEYIDVRSIGANTINVIHKHDTRGVLSIINIAATFPSDVHLTFTSPAICLDMLFGAECVSMTNIDSHEYPTLTGVVLAIPSKTIGVSFVTTQRVSHFIQGALIVQVPFAEVVQDAFGDVNRP